MTKNQRKSILTFIVNDKTYALSVLNVQGVIGNPKITPVINAPNSVSGVILVANNFVPILDLRLILNGNDLKNENKICIIIAKIYFKGVKKNIGFRVDSFSKIFDIQADDIEKLPTTENKEIINYAVNIKDKILLFLNIENLINSENLICFLNQIWEIEKRKSDAGSCRRNENGI